MNKFLKGALLATCLSTSSMASANDNNTDVFSYIPGEFSGAVAITSDYTFRGISQTDENPAIQGSIDYAADLGDGLGIYLGTWASNVDFNDNSDASTEFDYYGGLTYGVDDLSFDIGVIYYDYPGSTETLDYDYIEYMASVGYDFGVANTAVSINYSPENFGDTGEAKYYKLSVEAPLPYGVTADAHIGRQEVEDNTNFGVPDYTDWSVGLTYNIKGLDVSVHYVDTNLSDTECTDGCDAKAVLTVSKSF